MATEIGPHATVTRHRMAKPHAPAIPWKSRRRGRERANSWLLGAVLVPVAKSKLSTKPPSDTSVFIPTSVVLQRLHDDAPTGHFTLSWLMGSLRKRSFGIIMLLLAVVAMAPGVCVVAGLLLMIPAFQMIAGHSVPVFPRRISIRPLPTRHRGICADPPEQRRPRPGDRADLAGLSRRGRALAFDRPRGRHHRTSGGGGDGVGNGPRRRMDRRPLVTYLRSFVLGPNLTTPSQRLV